MLKAGMKLFLVLPDESGARVLHPASVVSVSENECVAELKEPEWRVRPGTDIFVYRKIDRALMKQSARVRSVDPHDGPNLSFEIVGEPVSAESRGCYRVSALGADISARFGFEPDCEVLDVSATGFSVCTSARHILGSRVDAVIRFGGESYRGKVVIQSMRRLNATTFRYGVHCIDDKKHAMSLKAALPRINMAIQGQQIRASRPKW